MTRDEYLTYRINKMPDPLYEYYKENYKGDKLMNKTDFFMVIQIWPFVQMAYDVCISHYDIQFNIVKIEDLKTGQIIKFI